jgi:hypothetical protein
MMNFKRSTVRALLACVGLVPMFVIASVSSAEATTIPFSFSETFTYDTNTTVHRFEFGDNAPGFPASTFSYTLQFDTVLTAFQATVTANSTLTRILPPGYVCIPIAGTETSCVEFTVTGPNGPNDPGEPNNFTGLYRVLIQWFYDTDPHYPDDPNGRVRILHYRNDGSQNDMTIPGTYFSPGNPPSEQQCFGESSDLALLMTRSELDAACGFSTDELLLLSTDGDPGVAGREDSFSTMIVAQAPNPNAAVPEPGTMILLGSGVALLAAVRRRANR